HRVSLAVRVVSADDEIAMTVVIDVARAADGRSETVALDRTSESMDHAPGLARVHHPVAADVLRVVDRSRADDPIRATVRVDISRRAQVDAEPIAGCFAEHRMEHAAVLSRNGPHRAALSVEPR